MPSKPQEKQGGQPDARAGQLFPLGDSGIPLRLIRSPRRTLAIEVRPGNEVLLRSPMRLGQETRSFARSRGNGSRSISQRGPCLNGSIEKRKRSFGKGRDTCRRWSPARRLLASRRPHHHHPRARALAAAAVKQPRFPTLMILSGGGHRYVALHEAAHLRR